MNECFDDNRIGPVKPNFFIVGAMKAGTTTLYDILKGHPNIFMPFDKEPYYFNWSGEKNSRDLKIPSGGGRLAASSDWQWCSDEATYLEVFSEASKAHAAIGEASTFYLPDENVPDKIKEFQPNAKIIIVLRQPVDRVISAYNFMRSFGAEPCADILSALVEEEAGCRDNWLYGWRYLHLSRYSEQVRRYIDCFGEANIKIVLFEELVRSPEDIVGQVLEFLGVGDNFKLEYSKMSNKTIINNKIFSYVISRLFWMQPKIISSLKKMLPIYYRRKLKSVLLRCVRVFGKSPEKPTVEEYEVINRYLAEDIKRLKEITKLSLDVWG